uniref:Cyclin-like domain-containing protein n=1 Tax=Glossina palpalis gambiensis TaxID=67801 RepID=A0A1B0BUF1_9MUSC
MRFIMNCSYLRHSMEGIIEDVVNDIDEGDGENLLLLCEYVDDIYDHLLELEFEQPIVKNPLEGQVEVNINMHAVLIDWINEVPLQFRLIPKTFQMAVTIIDRYLQSVTDTKQLQLVGIAPSSLCLSLNILKGNDKLSAGLDDSYWTPSLQWYSRYRLEHIKPIARKVAAIARNAQTAKLKAVYNK